MSFAVVCQPSLLASVEKKRKFDQHQLVYLRCLQGQAFITSVINTLALAVAVYLALIRSYELLPFAMFRWVNRGGRKEIWKIALRIRYTLLSFSLLTRFCRTL